MTLHDISELVAIYAHYVNNTEMRQRLAPIIENFPAWVCVDRKIYFKTMADQEDNFHEIIHHLWKSFSP